MNERNPVRDRILVLRVLIPSLAQALRDKMKEVNDTAAAKMPPNSSTADFAAKETLLDLDGVVCEPPSSASSSSNNNNPGSDAASTKWTFQCDGESYPARLVNLPCPVELHKTHDHVMYYKSGDLAQMLIVYEDDMAMEEAENLSGYKHDDYPSYYHSGLTPPLKRVVERRFTKREHKAVPPPRSEVAEIEEHLKELVDRLQDPGGSSGGGRAKTKLTKAAPNRVLEDVQDEIVDYEPWMDDYGRQPKGIEVDSEDPIVTKHPELFLAPGEFLEVTRVESEKEERKKHQAQMKKEKKKKKKKKAAAAAAAAAAAPESSSSTKSQRKNVAKTSAEPVDEMTEAAKAMLAGEASLDVLGEEFDGLGFAFDLDENELGLDNMDLEL